VAWKACILVVANRTADSDELLAALRDRGNARFELVVPATTTGGVAAGRRLAEEQLASALERMREAGLEAEGKVGDPDPYVATRETWDPARFDEIVVSTLPTGTSKWLQADLPHRVERTTGAPVRHVVASERRATPAPD
jgi:hypothetical protein